VYHHVNGKDEVVDELDLEERMPTTLGAAKF
jgi:hypothetical protein